MDKPCKHEKTHVAVRHASGIKLVKCSGCGAVVKHPAMKLILLISITALIGCQNNYAPIQSKCQALQLKYDSLLVEASKCDSIADELLYAETELNRYQIAYKIFLRKNPEAAAQYGDIISEETE